MTDQPHPGAVALVQAAARRAGMPPEPITPRAATTRTWAALKDLQSRATPDCPTCGGKGYSTQRVEYGFAGCELTACHCTENREND